MSSSSTYPERTSSSTTHLVTTPSSVQQNRFVIATSPKTVSVVKPFCSTSKAVDVPPGSANKMNPCVI